MVYIDPKTKSMYTFLTILWTEWCILSSKPYAYTPFEIGFKQKRCIWRPKPSQYTPFSSSRSQYPHWKGVYDHQKPLNIHHF